MHQGMTWILLHCGGELTILIYFFHFMTGNITPIYSLYLEYTKVTV